MAADGTAVDVVLPVYGPSPDLERCLASLRAGTDLSANRLLVVADGPLHEGPSRLVRELEEAAPRAVVRLGSEARRGYVARANEGMRATGRDVVLLNSDTEVPPGWLEGLRDAARSAPDVASATPFSSNATLCSLPFPFTANRVPAGHDVASFARLVAERAARLRPTIPTGVGFCLYLRRDALEDAGLFDEEAFGLGYGEEVDLCLRLAARGWRHVLDDATYVWHRGGGSFGDETTARARAAERLLARRHPTFLPRLAEFMREDPLRQARARVLEALRPARATPPRPLPRVLHLAPGWPEGAGGVTESRVKALSLRQAARGEVAVCAPRGAAGPGGDPGVELWDSGVRVRFVGRRDAGGRASLERFLDDVRPELLHVHEPGGALEEVLRLARRRGVPILVHIHEEVPRREARPRWLPRLLESARRRALLGAQPYVADSGAVLASWVEAGLVPGAAPAGVLPGAGSPSSPDEDLRRIEEVYAGILASGGIP